jgi:hypothetical protein
MPDHDHDAFTPLLHSGKPLVNQACAYPLTLEIRKNSDGSQGDGRNNLRGGPDPHPTEHDVANYTQLRFGNQ